MLFHCTPERKTRLEPTLRVGNTRELYLHPRPLRGEIWGRSFEPESPKIKKVGI